MGDLNKTTVAPLEWVHQDLSTAELPFVLADNLSVESVRGKFPPETFALWRDILSKREREDLPSIDVAIVHRFTSTGHVGREAEESKNFCYRAFIALRLVKPTRSRYSAIQYKMTGEGEIDVFGFTHPSQFPVNTPEAEALNRIQIGDLIEARGVLPALESVSANGPEYLRRAIRYFDMGYASIPFPEIQFITWVMGIETAIADGSKRPPRRSELIEHILGLVDPSTQIYANSPWAEFLRLPSLTVEDVLPDLLRLRSTLAHGAWMPDWRPDFTRPTLSGKSLSYPEMLLEAAPLILRKLILARLMSSAHRG